MKILVTGAAGFIGSFTATALKSIGHEVVAVDSFSPYYSTHLKKLRKEMLLDPSQITFLELDLSDKKSTDSLFADAKFDFVVHLSAQPGVRLEIDKWDHYVRDNLEAFSNVLLSSIRGKVLGFVYASSSSVYGSATGATFNEFTTGTKPTSFYGATKLANENLAMAASRNSGIKTRGLRFFTVYGPWGRPDMVYFRMVNGALNLQPFDFYGSGELLRDFTYIDDVVSSIVSLIENLLLKEYGFSDTVNVGGGKPISINSCLRLLEEIIGCSIPFIRLKADPRDIAQTCADFSYLSSLTGNHPTTAIDQGLKSFVYWAERPEIKQHLSAWTFSIE